MRKARGERGQILAVVALALIALLGVGAFAIDVGYAYYAKRQLQSATDAAALAGAQDLPNGTTAISVATTYAAANVPPNLSGLTFTYQTKCTATAVIATGCNALVNPNALVVTGQASTDTWFAKMFGIDHFDVSTHANACSPCSSTPVDIVVAIDRTGSMCDNWNRNVTCDDLDNAKDGVQTMLKALNPPYAEVGMIAFPPVRDTSTSACAAPYNSLGNNGFDAYDSPTRGYVTDTVNGNYKSGNSLDPASGLVIHTTKGPATSCVQSAGSTSYSEALRQSQAELVANGRPSVPDYIVFLTDGEANMGSVYSAGDPKFYPGNADDQRPCQTAIDEATTIKATGTTIYSIGYALGNRNCTAGGFGPNIPAVKDANGNIITPSMPCTPFTAGCYHKQSFNGNESPAITSNSTLTQIASPGNFYNQPNAASLDAIFAAIATDIAQGSSRLVDDGF